jgi:O-antigen ligase
MLSRLGIETRLQLAITICVISVIVVTTLGGSGGAPWVFLTYRTLLVAIGILSAIGSRHADTRISPILLACTGLFFALTLVSVLRIPGSHFEGFYLWSKYALFAIAFLNLAAYARHQSARWKILLLVTVLAVDLVHLLPDLILNRDLVKGFSTNNGNYFATYLLIGLAVSIALAVYTLVPEWRAAAACCGAVILFGIIKTSSRGATLAVIAMIIVAGIRARGRIPRQVWLGIGFAGLLVAIVVSPYLIHKFVDRGESDPYNYARKEIWQTALQVIAQQPMLGVGFGQFIHVSKRFALPVQGPVARYMKRAQMAHNEYLQHIGELGFPAALLLFVLIGSLVFISWKRAAAAWPDFRCFHEAALLTAIGVGIHALVDNCWTIPVTASALVVLALGDPLPLRKKDAAHRWSKLEFAFAGTAAAVLYAFFIAIPGTGLYYNDQGHKAYDRDDFATAKRYHLAALAVVPNHPLFLDNLGMVYLQEFSEKRDAKLLEFAKLYFAKAIAANPRAFEPEMHMETVLVRALTGDPARDREINRDIVRTDTDLLAIDPYVPFARKNLAGAYFNLGDFNRAIEEVQKAVEYEPNYVPGYLQMAIWYRDRGNIAASDRETAIGMAIINKYRNFKPTEPYEGVLLGRPEQAIAALTTKP